MILLNYENIFRKNDADLDVNFHNFHIESTHERAYYIYVRERKREFREPERKRKFPKKLLDLDPYEAYN